MNNNTITQKNYLDLIALIISIISFFTCSSCFFLGITGLVLSLLVILDNKGRYNKIQGYIALSLSIVSIIMMLGMLVLLMFSGSSHKSNEESEIPATTTTSIITTSTTETTTSTANSTTTTTSTTSTTTTTTTVTTTTSTTTVATTTNTSVQKDEEYKLVSDTIKNKPYVSGRDFLKNRGYSATYEHEVTHLDFTIELECYTDDELNNAGFIITGIKSYDYAHKKIALYVNAVDNINRIESQKNTQQILEENFDPSVAVGTLEMYGKQMYPYGFSLHMMTGKLAETAVDENTWFLKYKASVTNEFGVKEDVTCEAKVKGPESNPSVYDFYVY